MLIMSRSLKSGQSKDPVNWISKKKLKALNVVHQMSHNISTVKQHRSLFHNTVEFIYNNKDKKFT